MPQDTLQRFLSLPVNSDDTWQGGMVPMADMLDMPASDGLAEMALVLWHSNASEFVHAKPISLSRVSPLDAIVEVMFEIHTEAECPYRPARIECNDHDMVTELNGLLADSGTTVSYVAEMARWNTILRDMQHHIGAAAPLVPSLTDAGCTEQQIREFADAAAAFYRAALWDLLGDVDLITIETPRPPRYLKHAVVLGAASETYGLGFYDDAEDHYDLMARRGDPRDLSLFNLSFDSLVEVHSGDVDLWNDLGLPLETADAFPSLNFFSGDESRRPSPKELDFTTVVLKALAATSEDEIDFGRWTKSIELFGKRKKCVLSIPNLLDPPDHKEWLRRGMTPESRGQERHFKLVREFIENQGGDLSLDELNAAINAKFTGPMDAFEFPMDSPADRADAICQQAYDAFGRRRVLLAKQALAEDPAHVDASILVAEATRPVERRIELFRNAKENAKTKLGPVMKADVGHFWGLSETRPFMRACHGLAAALHEAGQTNEAIEQYQEMLYLNPEDNQGVRYEIIPLLLAHDREPEALKLLDKYREETAFWHYMKSLVEFRRSGRSANSKKAMRSAFRSNQHVVEMMQSTEPPFFPDSYSEGSPEEAAICIRELADAWDETEGYVEWMFREHFLWEKERSKQLREQKRKQRKKASSQKRRR